MNIALLSAIVILGLVISDCLFAHLLNYSGLLSTANRLGTIFNASTLSLFLPQTVALVLMAMACKKRKRSTGEDLLVQTIVYLTGIVLSALFLIEHSAYWGDAGVVKDPLWIPVTYGFSTDLNSLMSLAVSVPAVFVLNTLVNSLRRDVARSEKFLYGPLVSVSIFAWISLIILPVISDAIAPYQFYEALPHRDAILRNALIFGAIISAHLLNVGLMSNVCILMRLRVKHFAVCVLGLVLAVFVSSRIAYAWQPSNCHMLNGSLAMMAGKCFVGLYEFDTAIKIDPRNKHAYRSRANLYRIMDMTAEAERDNQMADTL